MQRLAAVIGEESDEGYFEGLTAEARKFWNDTFVDPSTGRTRGADGSLNETQCSYALPLAYEVFDEKYKEGAYRYLAEATEKVGCTISTGFFGTGVICPMLSEGGNNDLAYDMLLQTKFPSWLYPVTQGATTIWERWNSFTVEKGFGGNNSMNSFNHYSLGSVLSWIYETVLGIQRDEKNPGFSHFTLKPDIRKLTRASGCILTPCGVIESGWESGEDGVVFRCVVPANTSATVILPDGTVQEVYGGEHCFRICR